MVLKIQVAKTRDIKTASNGKIYVRRGAQNLPIEDQNRIEILRRDKDLATPEEIILDYLRTHDEIANRTAREICYIGSENKMKRILQQMVMKRLIESVPERTRYNAAYRLPKRKK